MSNSKGWYQLHSMEDVNVAVSKGQIIEFTAWPDDRIDAPSATAARASNYTIGGGWIEVSASLINPSHFEDGDRLRSYGYLTPTKTIPPIAYQQYRESLDAAIENGGLPSWVVALLEEGREYLDAFATKNFTFEGD